MLLKAKTIEAYDEACRLPESLPLGFPNVDIDPDTFKLIDNPENKFESSAVGKFGAECPQ